MFIFKSSEQSGEFGFSGRQIKEALDKSQAIISFTPDGIILHANENFLSATGYRLEDIVGKHHSIFCEDAYTRTAEYKEFWADLRDGKFQSNSFKRINRSGKAIYIQATYNPIHDVDGSIVGVIKYCTDITIPTLKTAEAVARTQASITFTPEGVIKDANDTFLAATGYRLDEIQSQHHRMFCPPDIVNSSEYQSFWADLAAGASNTVESARAGDAGRGFAVVAGEVKNLASSATNFTQSIAKEIEAVQAISGEISENMEHMINSISDLSTSTAFVATAIEQQNVVVSDIAIQMEDLTTLVAG